MQRQHQRHRRRQHHQWQRLTFAPDVSENEYRLLEIEPARDAGDDDNDPYKVLARAGLLHGGACLKGLPGAVGDDAESGGGEKVPPSPVTRHLFDLLDTSADDAHERRARAAARCGAATGRAGSRDAQVPCTLESAAVASTDALANASGIGAEDGNQTAAAAAAEAHTAAQSARKRRRTLRADIERDVSLCTAYGTYAVRFLESSNSMLVHPASETTTGRDRGAVASEHVGARPGTAGKLNHERGGDNVNCVDNNEFGENTNGGGAAAASDETTHADVVSPSHAHLPAVCAVVHGSIECARVPPRFGTLRALFVDRHRYTGSGGGGGGGGGAADSDDGWTWHELLDVVHASERELADALVAMNIVRAPRRAVGDDAADRDARYLMIDDDTLATTLETTLDTLLVLGYGAQHADGAHITRTLVEQDGVDSVLVHHVMRKFFDIAPDSDEVARNLDGSDGNGGGDSDGSGSNDGNSRQMDDASGGGGDNDRDLVDSHRTHAADNTCARQRSIPAVLRVRDAVQCLAAALLKRRERARLAHLQRRSSSTPLLSGRVNLDADIVWHPLGELLRELQCRLPNDAIVRKTARSVDGHARHDGAHDAGAGDSDECDAGRDDDERGIGAECLRGVAIIEWRLPGGIGGGDNSGSASSDRAHGTATRGTGAASALTSAGAASASLRRGDTHGEAEGGVRNAAGTDAGRPHGSQAPAQTRSARAQRRVGRHQMARRLVAAELPIAPRARLAALFAVKSEWTRDELQPYVHGLSESDLHKYARVATQAGAVANAALTRYVAR